eukprot:jgi/Chlat1/133/Chrsp1S03222
MPRKKRVVEELSDDEEEREADVLLIEAAAATAAAGRRRRGAADHAVSQRTSARNGGAPLQLQNVACSPSASQEMSSQNQREQQRKLRFCLLPLAKGCSQDNEVSELHSPSGARPAEAWTGIFAPKSENELAVQKKKVQEVRDWLETQHSSRRQGGVLLLSGPVGAGKSAVVRVLARHLGFDICEWNTPVPMLWSDYIHNSTPGMAFLHHIVPEVAHAVGLCHQVAHYFHALSAGVSYASKLDEFAEFLGHVSKFPTLKLATTSLVDTAVSSPANSTPVTPDTAQPIKKLVLIDDLPYANDSTAARKLFSMLRGLALAASFPTIVIMSDDSVSSSGTSRETFQRTMARDCQAALLAGGATKIAFNPMTTAAVAKAIKRIAVHTDLQLPDEALEQLAESSGGDLRHAIATLQFSYSTSTPVTSTRGSSRALPRKRRRKQERWSDGFDKANRKHDFIAAGRDDVLSTFHAVGKLLYNKRLDEHGAVVRSALVPEACSQASQESPNAVSPQYVRRRLEMRQEPEAVLAEAHLDGSSATAFLHENMLHFFHDDAMEEAADALSCISDADMLLRAPRRAIGRIDLRDLEPGQVAAAAAASVASRGLLFHNTRPSESRWLPIRGPMSAGMEVATRRNMDELREAFAAMVHCGASSHCATEPFVLELLPLLRRYHRASLGFHHTPVHIPVPLWRTVRNRPGVHDGASDDGGDIGALNESPGTIAGSMKLGHLSQLLQDSTLTDVIEDDIEDAG